MAAHPQRPVPAIKDPFRENGIQPDRGVTKETGHADKIADPRTRAGNGSTSAYQTEHRYGNRKMGQTGGCIAAHQNDPDLPASPVETRDHVFKPCHFKPWRKAQGKGQPLWCPAACRNIRNIGTNRFFTDQIRWALA